MVIYSNHSTVVCGLYPTDVPTKFNVVHLISLYSPSQDNLNGHQVGCYTSQAFIPDSTVVAYHFWNNDVRSRDLVVETNVLAGTMY